MRARYCSTICREVIVPAAMAFWSSVIDFSKTSNAGRDVCERSAGDASRTVNAAPTATLWLTPVEGHTVPQTLLPIPDRRHLELPQLLDSKAERPMTERIVRKAMCACFLATLVMLSGPLVAPTTGFTLKQYLAPQYVAPEAAPSTVVIAGREIAHGRRGPVSISDHPARQL